MFYVLVNILIIIIGFVIPYLVFVVYQRHVLNNHKGGDDWESLMEGLVFGFGFMCTAFIPIGIINLIW